MFLQPAGCALNKRGFTLVELLIAAALFLMATVAFSFILRTGKVSVRSAANLNQATYTLVAKMEKIKSLPFSQLPALNNSSFANGAGKVFVAPVLADLLSIDLALNWQAKKLPLKLYTLRSEY